MQHDILSELMTVLAERKQASADSSYVASLYHSGLERILKKVGEEAIETVMAAKDGDAQHIVYEVADLWFHTLVLLSHQNISHTAVLEELSRRFGLSGHDEKNSRLPSCDAT